jgi:hypothetical protein
MGLIDGVHMMKRLLKWLQGAYGWISLLISVAAFIVSGITSWVNVLGPFNPRLMLGGVLWRQETPKGEVRPIITVVALLVLVNQGAREECILDVIADIKARNRRSSWRFHPAFYVSMERYVQGLRAGRPGAEVAEAMFYPVFFAGRSQVAKAVIFLPRDRTAAVEEDEYVVEVSGKSCGEKKYTVGDRGTFELGREQVAAVRRGEGVWTVSKEVSEGR